MIARVKKIQGIGTFSGFTNGGAAPFGPLTVIYGENCTGKSTLSDILRSLGVADSGIIEKRRSIVDGANPESQVVHITYGHNNREASVRFADGRWGQWPFEVAVFDSRFVNDNIYTGDALTRENREHLSDLLVGAASVRILHRLERISGWKRVLRTKTDVLRRSIEERLAGELDIDSFVVMEVDATLEETSKQEQLASERIEQIGVLLGASDQIRAYEFPGLSAPKMRLTILLRRLNSAVSQTILNASAGAMRDIHRHLEAHFRTRDGGEVEWIRRGVELYLPQPFDAATSCPFCGNPLSDSGVPFVMKYQEAFNDAFRIRLENTSAEIDSVGATISDEFESVMRLDVQRYVAAAREFAALSAAEDEDLFIGDLKSKAERFSSLRSQYATAVEPTISRVRSLLALRESGMTSAMSQVQIPAEVDSLERDLTAAIEELVESVEATRAALVGLRDSTVDDDLTEERTELEERLSELRLQKLRIGSAGDCERYTRGLRRIDELDTHREDKSRELEIAQDAYAKTYGESLSRWFDRFGSRDFTVRTVSDRRGARPVIRLELEYRGERVDSSALSATMSESDKRALGFAAFWSELLLRDQDRLSMTVVVLDDPVVSFDVRRTGITASYVSELVESCRQVLVLSHYVPFLQDLNTAAKSRELTPTFVKIERAKGASGLSPISSEELFQSPRAKAQETIYRFVNDESSTDVWEQLRVLLESEVRSRHWWVLRSSGRTGVPFAQVLATLEESGSVPREALMKLKAHWALLSGAHHDWEHRPLEERRASARAVVTDLYGL